MNSLAKVMCVLLRTLILHLLLLLPPHAASSQVRQGGSVDFERGNSALDIPFELNSDKIYLQVMIDDQGPFSLVLDTGSPGMILDTRAGEALKATVGEAFDVGGAGETPFSLARADSTFDVDLPGMHLFDQPAHVAGIDAIVGPFEGRRIDGVLGGYNVFANYIVEIDYQLQRIGVWERESYDDSQGGTIVPIEIRGGHCVIEGRAIPADGDTLTGEFMLDTGLRGTMAFNTPFVNQNQLITRLEPTLYTTVGGGLGGQVRAHVGRLEDFVFGGFSLGPVYASLSQHESGALASDAYAGIIGSAVLQRFRVVFDYAGERLILFENDFDAGRLDFDKSGTFLVADVNNRSIYRVIDVSVGSPADEAGLAIGDVIRRIDGKSTESITLEQARRLFRREAGTTYSIEYERGGEIFTTSITLRKVI